MSGTSTLSDTPPATTRDAIAHILLRGPTNVAAIADELCLSKPGVRRHLDIMVKEGIATPLDPSSYMERTRGRPAKQYCLTETGRASFGHSYDDLAVDALRMLRQLGGEEALIKLAHKRISTVVRDIPPLDSRSDKTAISTQAHTIAAAFNRHGFATSIERAHGGLQICQHHCPVAHVAHEFPALCRVEVQILSTLLNTPLQRLSTIAHGSHTCTTNISVNTPPASLPHREKEDS